MLEFVRISMMFEFTTLLANKNTSVTNDLMHLYKQVICNDSPAAEFEYVMKCLLGCFVLQTIFPQNHLFNAFFTAKLDKKPDQSFLEKGVPSKINKLWWKK